MLFHTGHLPRLDQFALVKSYLCLQNWSNLQRDYVHLPERFNKTRIVFPALDPFPFWILQISLGLPLLAILMRFQWQRNGIGTTLLVAGIYIFLIGFVSRFFQDNYVGFVIVLILSGICLMAAEGEPFAMHTKVPE